MANEMDRVVPLGQLDDFKVAEGDPDVRGWSVVASDGRTIGEVDELLIDTGAMKVRYLDVEVENGLMTEPDRHVLVPIGYARLDQDADRVIVDNISSADLRTMPAYDQSALTRDYESSVRTSWDKGKSAVAGAAGAAAGAIAGAAHDIKDAVTPDHHDHDDFYKHDAYNDRAFFDSKKTGTGGGLGSGTLNASDEARITLSEEELAVGKRQVQAGEVEVRKTVETQHVTETVPVTHEEVSIERHPITGAAAGHIGEIGAQEIHVPLTQEELVVDKRVVPVEEVVVRKHEVTENQTVEADVRREHAEVIREGETVHGSGTVGGTHGTGHGGTTGLGGTTGADLGTGLGGGTGTGLGGGSAQVGSPTNSQGAGGSDPSIRRDSGI
ncbi:MAG TPA: DUF2382 domain-containing protein [Longimicrobium sp.]|nr:DUF2382 domain-containing protein [Longimicrobium sp.]